MNNQKSSIIIADLVAPEGNLRDFTNAELNQVKGGESASINETITLQANNGFVFSLKDGEIYTYANNSGEITETGTRPEGLEINTSPAGLQIITSTPLP